MKRLIFALVIFAGVAGALPRARAEVSIDFFYNTLGDSGSWCEVGSYGYAWQPTVAVGNSSWRPYADGYWAYTDDGWTWVSYEDFGWATYHYGRWVRLHDRGWFWVPGYQWAPAWVSWRTGSDYVGWAPLPPEFRDDVVYSGRPVYGYVDAEYDIGPLYYNFVDVRYIGEPVLRERIFEPAQNVVYMEKTVNVTNITYNNNVVYNYGPDYNTVSAYSARPIQRLALQRESTANVAAAAQGGALTKVQGDKLIVAAPPRLQKPAAPIAPKNVKETIARPTVEHGWSGIADQKAVAQLKQKIKTENPKQVPPPTIAPKSGAPVPAQVAAAAKPAVAPSTAPAPTSAAPDNSKTNPRNVRAQNAAPAPAATLPTRQASGAAKPKGEGKHSPTTQPGVAASPAPTAVAATAPKPKARNARAENGSPMIAQPRAASAAPIQPERAAHAKPQPKREARENAALGEANNRGAQFHAPPAKPKAEVRQPVLPAPRAPVMPRDVHANAQMQPPPAHVNAPPPHPAAPRPQPAAPQKNDKKKGKPDQPPGQ